MADESIVPEEESTALDISSKALDLLKGTGAYSRYPSGDSKAKITRATLWNRWKKIFIKKKISFKGADLTSANLTGFDLSDFDFSGANFTDANLTETILNDTIFTGAILEGVKFTRATLTNIVFSRNNLSFCNFCDTVCNNVKFLNCVITCANMPGFHRIADFGWAVLNKCEFRGVTFIGTSPISFTKAQITESTFFNVKFMHKNNFVIEVVFTSDLYNDPCIISNCTFNQVVFKPTFNSSKLTGVTFVKCGLDGMNANSASFSKCTFSMSSAKSSYFGATILNNVTFDNVGL